MTRGITDQRGPVRGASDLSQTGAPLRGAPMKRAQRRLSTTVPTPCARLRRVEVPPRRRASRAPPRRARRRLVRRAGGGQGPVGRAPPRRAHVLSRRAPHLLESSAGATRPARAHNFVSQLQFLSLQALRRFLYLFLFKSHCARSPIVEAQVKGLVSKTANDSLLSKRSRPSI